MWTIRSLSIGIINYRQLSSLSANSHLALFQNSTLPHKTMTQRNLYPYRNQGAFAPIPCSLWEESPRVHVCLEWFCYTAIVGIPIVRHSFDQWRPLHLHNYTCFKIHTKNTKRNGIRVLNLPLFHYLRLIFISKGFP